MVGFEAKSWEAIEDKGERIKEEKAGKPGGYKAWRHND
jgi:hypothetical protein